MKAGFGEEAQRAAARAPTTLGGVGHQQPVLGASRGDVEQPALLGQPLGGGDQVTAVVLARPGDELCDGGGTDPTARRADRPAVRLASSAF